MRSDVRRSTIPCMGLGQCMKITCIIKYYWGIHSQIEYVQCSVQIAGGMPVYTIRIQYNRQVIYITVQQKFDFSVTLLLHSCSSYACVYSQIVIVIVLALHECDTILHRFYCWHSVYHLLWYFTTQVRFVVFSMHCLQYRYIAFFSPLMYLFPVRREL